jgi:hypothetical protein
VERDFAALESRLWTTVLIYDVAAIAGAGVGHWHAAGKAASLSH